MNGARSQVTARDDWETMLTTAGFGLGHVEGIRIASAIVPRRDNGRGVEDRSKDNGPSLVKLRPQVGTVYGEGVAENVALIETP